MSTNHQIGISDRVAQEWWDYFCQHPGFSSIWSPIGWGTKEVLPSAKDAVNTCNPTPQIKGEQTALLIPIADRDWSLRSAQFQDKSITTGALWACMTAFSLIDLLQRKIYTVPYGVLNGVEQNGDGILLSTTTRGSIHLVLRVPRPFKHANTIGFVFDVLASLGSKSAADSEAVHQRSEREAKEIRQKTQMADIFVQGIFDFFSRTSKGLGSLSDIHRLVP